MEESDGVRRGSAPFQFSPPSATPSFRRLAELVKQTEAQSLPEVVKDLGNFTVIFPLALAMSEGILSKEELWGYRAVICSSVKVLRLVEEGRQNPQAVVALLRDEIAGCLAGFEEARLRWKREAYEPRTVGYSEVDPYYETHRRYEDSMSEFVRLHNVATMGFYALANLDRLPADLLAAWLRRPREPGWYCLDMDVWLVDAYYRQAPDSARAALHRELTGDRMIAGTTVRQSVWNAPFHVRVPLPPAGPPPDLIGVPTLAVLDIPRELPADLATEAKEKIILNFLNEFGR